MTRYLVDTCVLVDVSRTREPASTWIRQALANPNVLGICGVIVTEFLTGLTPVQQQAWLQFLHGFEIWDHSLSSAAHAGNYCYTFARQGITLATPDMMIAAVAYEQQATLVTNNLRHFPMRDITVTAPVI